jgi:hypothetical protein
VQALLQAIPAADRVVGRAAPGFHRAGLHLLLLIGTPKLHPVAVRFEHGVEVVDGAPVVEEGRLADDPRDDGVPSFSSSYIS